MHHVLQNITKLGMFCKTEAKITTQMCGRWWQCAVHKPSLTPSLTNFISLESTYCHIPFFYRIFVTVSFFVLSADIFRVWLVSSHCVNHFVFDYKILEGMFKGLAKYMVQTTYQVETWKPIQKNVFWLLKKTEIWHFYSAYKYVLTCKS